MKRQHNLHTFLLGLGCTIWLPPANGTEWRSIGPVERVGVAAGGVTNNVLTSNKTSATFDGDDGLVDLGTIPANDVLQLQGAFTISVLCTPTLTGDAVQRFVDKSDGGNGANGYALVIGVSNELQMLIGGSTTARGATSLVASRQLLTYINDGIANVALYNGGTTITLASDSWRLAPNVATNMRFGSWNHSTGREFNGDMELVAIHPTRDLTETELAHAWALAQEF